MVNFIQVKEHFFQSYISETAEGLYPAHEKLPGEKTRCLRFDVERNTVRKALQILVDERRILRIPGIGSRILSLKEPEKTLRRPGPRRGIPRCFSISTRIISGKPALRSLRNARLRIHRGPAIRKPRGGLRGTRGPRNLRQS